MKTKFEPVVRYRTTAGNTRHRSVLKGWLFYLLIGCLFSLTSNEAFAQQPDTVHKDWTMLGEDTSHIDVSYRVVKCTASSANQIQLSVFNENPVAKTASFTLTIKDNASNTTTTAQISFACSAASLNMPDCGSTLSGLKVNVPSGYDPANLTVTITF